MRALHLVGLLLSLALPAAAHPESATEALKARDAEIRAALPPPGVEPSPAVRAKLESIVTRAVDLDGMVQKAMGKSWGQATPAQKKRIVGAFTKRFGALTGGQLDSYRSTDVAYGAEAPGADGTTTVPTKVVVKGEPTEIAYALRRQGAAWRIEDVVIDGASTVEGFRSSFAKTIAKEGIAGLVTKLEKAAAQKAGPKAGAQAAPKAPAGAKP
ncbi:MAG: ABC transporter substrate-binding protein [Anaeromyxobacter sp.]